MAPADGAELRQAAALQDRRHEEHRRAECGFDHRGAVPASLRREQDSLGASRHRRRRISREQPECVVARLGHGMGRAAAQRTRRGALRGLTETLFYHLERRSLDDVLPGVIEKTLERGWRALIRVESSERADAIDNLLWTYSEQTFLPHAPAGDGNPNRQPVLITVEEDNPNAANVLFLV